MLDFNRRHNFDIFAPVPFDPEGFPARETYPSFVCSSPVMPDIKITAHNDRETLVDTLKRLALHHYAFSKFGMYMLAPEHLKNFQELAQRLGTLHSTYSAARFSKQLSFSEVDCEELFGGTWSLTASTIAAIAAAWKEESKSMTRSEICAAQKLKHEMEFSGDECDYE